MAMLPMPQTNAGAIDFKSELSNNKVVTRIYKLELTTKPKVRANTFFIESDCLLFLKITIFNTQSILLLVNMLLTLL
ncbi:hypothetical protein BDD43_2067 [Mucilaginibacter gracilis]|uniref:Uncharacterized protein n=1 Tax=Mucilaginibacter gracilis TaxID=423350 RepID=A0A495IYW9_9SPHI|nr:hypothetical protein BDD43_2067 [Mucilaginibacter gracilis]